MSPRLISLFTGAGGLDLGFEAAGFETAVAVEFDRDCAETILANRDWPLIPRDIHQVSSSEILSRARLREGDADALIGGPPCQPFSKSGYWASGDTLRLDDSRAGTLEAYLRVLRDTLPKTYLLENVEGLIYRGKSEGLGLLERTIGEINRDRGVAYSFEVRKLNAAHYGVPQLRERVFVVGDRSGASFSFPKATHSDPDKAELLGKPAFTTAWDAIGDLEGETSEELRVRGKWADLLPSIPEGKNYLWHTERGGGFPLFGWRRRYWSFLLKLAKRLPSWTLQAQPGPATGPFHWSNRRLSSKELCRLQAWPGDFKVCQPISVAQKQLGNAVPAALAEALARSMLKQFLDHDVDPIPTLIPRRRRPIPDEEPVEQVPETYHHLAGEHDPHPGTGKGYAASARRVVL